MPAVDTAAVTAHQTANAALAKAMYRPVRSPYTKDPLVVAAKAAAAQALVATNAATVNPTQALTLSLQLRKFSRQLANVDAVLGVKRRHAIRALRNATKTLAALHAVNV